MQLQHTQAQRRMHGQRRMCGPDMSPPLPHDFDGFFDVARRCNMLSAAHIDDLTDRIASGQCTELGAVAEAWPTLREHMRCCSVQEASSDSSPPAPAVVKPPVGAQSHFSLANELSRKVHPLWDDLKARGNEALANDETEVALRWYARAASITRSIECVSCFFDGCHE